MFFFLSPLMKMAQRISNYYSDFDLKTLLRLSPDILDELPLIMRIEQETLEKLIAEYLAIAEPKLSRKQRERRSSIVDISEKDLHRGVTFIYTHKREYLKPMDRVEEFSFWEDIFG